MGRERRFLVRDLDPNLNDEIVAIVGSEAHHLHNVLRLRPGQEVIVFDGRGRAFRAQLETCRSEKALARIIGPAPAQESPLALSLAVAILPGDRMSVLLEKLTELGVSRFIPVVSERGKLRDTESARARLPRWKRIVEAACKQAGRARLMDIEAPTTFANIEKLSLPPGRFLMSSAGASLPRHRSVTSCIALVGPEGGFTPDEVAAAQGWSFEPWTLGPRTLRSETAALASAALLQCSFGDLSARVAPGSSEA